MPADLKPEGTGCSAGLRLVVGINSTKTVARSTTSPSICGDLAKGFLSITMGECNSCEQGQGLPHGLAWNFLRGMTCRTGRKTCSATGHLEVDRWQRRAGRKFCLTGVVFEWRARPRWRTLVSSGPGLLSLFARGIIKRWPRLVTQLLHPSPSVGVSMVRARA